MLAWISWKRQHTIPVLLLVASVIALNFLGLFSQKFFRDFSIVFEGGYRIYRGQIPFRDFFIPLGPVSLYLQAFFNFLLGPNLSASALHAGALAAILCSLFYVVTVEKLGKGLAFFLGIALFFSYTGVINYPWYNETAYFFLILNVLLILAKIDMPQFPAPFLIYSSALTVLGIFSKQDVGILHFIFIGGYFAWSQGIKKTVLYFILPALALTAATVLAFQSIGNFIYWFNYGQRPSDSHLASFLSLERILSLPFAALVGGAIAYFTCRFTREEQKRLFLLMLLIAVPFVTSFTSGNPSQTCVQGIPIMLYLLGDLLMGRFPAILLKFKKAVTTIYILSALLLLNMLPLLGQYILGNFFVGNDAQQPPFVQKMLRSYDYLGYTKIEQGAYKNCVIRQGHLVYLEAIREVLQKGRGDFFNMSEFEFLYTDFNVNPPKGFPLWFDHGVSYFDEDLPLLRDNVLALKPEIILLQDPHTNKKREIKFHLFYFYTHRGYQKILTSLAPAVAKIEVLVRA